MSLVLHFKASGAGEPIVLLHGLFGSASNWGSVAKQLQQDYRVVRADLRNHGDSPHAKSMSYREMADDVFALLDRLALSKTHLIGHSLGGKVAMVCALLCPLRVQQLIVVDSAPVAYGRGFDDIIESLRALPLDEIPDRKAADRWLASRIEDASLRSFLLQNLRFAEGRYRWRIDLEAIAANRDTMCGFPQLDSYYSGPVVFIRGEKSRYVREEHQPQIKRSFPNATLLTVPEAGHWPHSEQPERFMDLLSRSLGRD
ncbi:MAG: alpha/beta fold hydrolase [Gammaproteobacteria bacterium]